jgi:hypothetical protein
MKLIRHPDQPTTTDIKLAGGIFLKSTHFRHAGMIAPQHAHRYDHISYIAAGAVGVEVDGVALGEFSAPDSIVIKAGVMHLFTTLMPDTVVLCIHNTDRSGGDIETIPGGATIEFVEG